MKAIRLSAHPENRTRSARASNTWKNPKASIASLNIPEPGPRELLLRVEYCGLCGSDFHLTEQSEDGSILYPGLLELPVVLGHEFSATVTGYGSEITDEEKNLFPLNSAVTAEEMLWCGECPTCRSGNVNHCEHLEELGFTRNGAQAEFISVGVKYCWSLAPLAESLGKNEALLAGALTEPYSVAYRALYQSAQGCPWRPDQSLVIFGAGPIGLACADIAGAQGAERIAVIEPLESRRELAKKLGVKYVYAGTEKDLAQTISRAFGGSVHWIIDAAGATNQALALAENSLAVGGSICLLARSEERGSFDPELLITKNARIFGSQGHSGDETFKKVIFLMAEKKLRPFQIIEKVIGFEEAVKRLLNHERSPGKLLLKPHEGDA